MMDCNGFHSKLENQLNIIEQQNAILSHFDEVKYITEPIIPDAKNITLCKYQNLSVATNAAKALNQYSALSQAALADINTHKYQDLSIAAKVAENFKQYEVLSQGVLKNIRTQLQTTVLPLQEQVSHYSIFGIANALNEYQQITAQINTNFTILSDIRKSFVNLYPEYDIEEDDIEDAEAVDEKIVSALINPMTGESFKESDKKLIITALPINEDILKYFAKNPQELYKIEPRYFEKLMAEIYYKLGYDVELTQATRDGGKDIILTDHSPLGDFVYYAECKHHEKESVKVGVGVVCKLYGTINMDRVNGGIVATNSFFTKDARDFILDNNCQCQVQLHDENNIREFLNKLVNR